MNTYFVLFNCTSLKRRYFEVFKIFKMALFFEVMRMCISPVSQFCCPTEIFVSRAGKILKLEQINVMLA